MVTIRAQQRENQESQLCPYCRETLSSDQDLVECTRCAALHHNECWSETKKCCACHNTVYGKPGDVANQSGPTTEDKPRLRTCFKCRQRVHGSQRLIQCAFCRATEHADCWFKTQACGVCRQKQLMVRDCDELYVAELQQNSDTAAPPSDGQLESSSHPSQQSTGSVEQENNPAVFLGLHLNELIGGSCIALLLIMSFILLQYIW